MNFTTNSNAVDLTMGRLRRNADRPFTGKLIHKVRELGYVMEETPGLAAISPPEHLPHWFERFYRADEARFAENRKGGAGLGLAIVHTIMKLHRGSITRESTPDRDVFCMTSPQVT